LIEFTKAHACGNDFLIVTEEAAKGHDWAELTRHLCGRNTGVGADGIEFFTWTGPQSGRIRLHNADGSIAEISGNGTRCVAAWMAETLRSKPGTDLHIDTDAGPRTCHVNAIDTSAGYTVEVTAGMGVPVFAPRIVTMPAGVQVHGVEVSTGNPHFVIVVDNPDFKVDGQAWQSVGQQIFPTRQTSNSSASLAPQKLKSASSSAASAPPPHPVPAPAPRPPRLSR